MMAKNLKKQDCGQTQKTTTLIDELSQNGFQVVAKSTKLLNSFPSGASRMAFCAYPSFGKIIDFQSDEIIKIVSKLLKSQKVKGNVERRQQDEQFEMVLDCNDIMLERINSSLDDLCGLKKKPEAMHIESQIRNPVQIKSGAWNSNFPQKLVLNKLSTSINIPRPQVSYNIRVNNSADIAFMPKISTKPNSLKPLAILPEYDSSGVIESFTHPYEFELKKFEPSDSQLKLIVPEKPTDITDAYIHIDSKEKLVEALNALKQKRKIAIDLEHNSYRSYQGITCLMQLSSNKNDYIIDPFVLRDDLEILNEILTDPNILKIFHGADLDIEWLQRDFGLYVVNMFDTHQAAKMLGLSRLSLKFLLKHYCNIDADKKFQLADWRIRPLPKELIFYARQDTHYLIYIAEIMHNELLNQPNGFNTLKAVYNMSKNICGKVYFKPKITEDSYMEMYKRSKRAFDNRQLYAIREIYLWRDNIARCEDESCDYILPNHMLLQIAEILPREMQGILACCNPIPYSVRQNLNTLHKIILKAREQPLVKVHIQREEINRVLIPAKDSSSKINYIYDMSNETEFKDDLVKFSIIDSFKPIDLHFKPILNIFEDNKNEKGKNWKINQSRGTKFVSPYQRYKAVLPIVEKQKREEEYKIKKENENIRLCPIKMDVNEDVILVKETPFQDSNLLSKQKSEVDVVNRTDSKHNKSERTKAIVVSKSKVSQNPKFSQNTTPTLNDANIPNIKNEKEEQNCTKYRNFDYAKVNFKQFEGGSHKPTKVDKKGGISKRNKINDKKYSKIFTFSSVNKKK